jgi:hypothetical protein
MLRLALAVALSIFLVGLAFGLAGHQFGDPPVLAFAGLAAIISGAGAWFGTRGDDHPSG